MKQKPRKQNCLFPAISLTTWYTSPAAVLPIHRMLGKRSAPRPHFRTFKLRKCAHGPNGRLAASTRPRGSGGATGTWPGPAAQALNPFPFLPHEMHNLPVGTTLTASSQQRRRRPHFSALHIKSRLMKTHCQCFLLFRVREPPW